MAVVTGSDIDGNPVVMALSRPTQLDLFQHFLGPEPQNYGNSIELYDAIPKFMPSAKEMDKMRRDGVFLPMLERNFRHRGQEHIVTISPARIQDKHGIEKEFYPSQRDWMVEEALRKLASSQNKGVYLDDGVGVRFSLSELRRELEGYNRGLTYESLMESLAVLSRSQMRIMGRDGATALNSPIFTYTLLPNRSQWLNHPDKRHCCVQFNPLVTLSINNQTFRQFDYKTFMELRSSLAQWFHRRLSHNYIQASVLDRYQIRLSTVIRDSGMLNSARLADNAKQARLALEELKHKNVLIHVEEKVDRGKRRSITEILFLLTPSTAFVDDMKRANKRQTKFKGKDSDSPIRNKKLSRPFSDNRKVGILTP